MLEALTILGLSKDSRTALIGHRLKPVSCREKKYLSPFFSGGPGSWNVSRRGFCF